MAEFFAKGPQSNFTKMSKQFAQEQVRNRLPRESPAENSATGTQVMQQAIMDYAAEKQAEEEARLSELREKELAAAGNGRREELLVRAEEHRELAAPSPTES